MWDSTTLLRTVMLSSPRRQSSRLTFTAQMCQFTHSRSAKDMDSDGLDMLETLQARERGAHYLGLDIFRSSCSIRRLWTVPHRLIRLIAGSCSMRATRPSLIAAHTSILLSLTILWPLRTTAVDKDSYHVTCGCALLCYIKFPIQTNRKTLGGVRWPAEDLELTIFLFARSVEESLVLAIGGASTRSINFRPCFRKSCQCIRHARSNLVGFVVWA